MDEQEREREIFMGALVSPGGGYDREKSIDVPCIILSTFFFTSSLLPPHSPSLCDRYSIILPALVVLGSETTGWGRGKRTRRLVKPVLSLYLNIIVHRFCLSVKINL